MSLMFVCYPFTVLVAAEPTVTLEGELSELLQTPNNPGLKTRDSRRAGTTKPGWGTQLFDVEVVLRMPPGRPPTCGSGSASMQDGVVTQRVLNGKTASEDDLAQAQFDCEERLFEYLSEREAVREQRHQQLMAELAPMMNKSYNAQQQWRHAQAAGNWGSAVRLKLTGAEIKAFAARQGDMAEAIRPYREPVSAFPSPIEVADAIGLNDHTFFRGIGLGVFISEAFGCSRSAIPLGNSSGGPYTNHGERVYQALSAAAPGANIRCALADYYPSPSEINQFNIQVSNHSWGRFSTPGMYESDDRTWDQRVYDTKIAIFVAAGNDAPFVVAPGKAFNVITVGGTNHVGGSMWANSNYRNPNTGAEKPEIVAPARYCFPSFSCDQGTSFASPMAAGAAASVISDFGVTLRRKPYLTKALLMASALGHNVEGHATLSDRDGAGAIDFNGSSFIGGGFYLSSLAWYEGPENGAPNTVTDSSPNYALKVTEPLTGLGLDEANRIVMSWLVRDDTSNQRWDLEILRPDGTVLRAYNNGTGSTFRIIDFEVGRPSGNGPRLYVDNTFRWVFYWQSVGEHCPFGGHTPSATWTNRCIVKSFSPGQAPPSNAPRLYIETHPQFPWVFYWQSNGGQCVHGGHTPSSTWTNRCIVRTFETSTNGFQLVRRLVSTTGDDVFIGHAIRH